jgi:tRNA A37 threonylcarbamoyladenosine dehydratase
MIEIGTWSLTHRKKDVDPTKCEHTEMLMKGGKELQKEVRKNLRKEHLG